MTWAAFLHWYQPANSEAIFINEAADASYRFLADVLTKHPEIRMTWNISGCLIERLAELGAQDVLDGVRRLAKRGQIELVGSAAFHPLLPLISLKEARRQIVVQEDILRSYLGVAKPVGFFCPEMGYSPAIGKLVKDMGYQYLILDELAIDGKRLGSGVYIDKETGMKVIVRSRRASNRYVPDYVVKKSKLGSIGGELIITANDAELYGLRHRDISGNLAALASVDNLKFALFSELAEAPIHRRSVALRASTWESSEEELSRGEAFAIWQGKDNNIQKKLWELADLAQFALERFEKDDNYGASLWHLSRGLASCMFWWASGHDFSRHFGSIAWSPDEVERGLNDLVRSIRAIGDKDSVIIKKKAEELSASIRKELWLAHWERQEARH